MQITLHITIHHVNTNPTAVKEHLPTTYVFSDCATPLCHVQVHIWSRNFLILLELGDLGSNTITAKYLLQYIQ